MGPKEKSEGERDRDSYSCFILGDSRGKMIKRLLQRVIKKIFQAENWVQMSLVSSEHSYRLFVLGTNLVKLFLLCFCSSQTENSLFYSLKPPYNTWNCLTTATTYRLLPTTVPATSSPQCCLTQQPQPHPKVLCRRKLPGTHPGTLWVFRSGIAEEWFVTDLMLILPLNVSCNWISAGNFLFSF